MRKNDDGSWYVMNMYYPDNMKHKRHVEWRKSNGKDFKAAEVMSLLGAPWCAPDSHTLTV
jgi:hypothetical protein